MNLEEHKLERAEAGLISFRLYVQDNYPGLKPSVITAADRWGGRYVMHVVSNGFKIFVHSELQAEWKKKACIRASASKSGERADRRYTVFGAAQWEKIVTFAKEQGVAMERNAKHRADAETGDVRLQATRKRTSEALGVDVDDIDVVSKYLSRRYERKHIAVNVVTDEDIANGHEEKFSLRLATIGPLTESELIALVESLRVNYPNTLPKGLRK